MLTLFLLAQAAAAVPTPLSEVHQRDIGCVATFALLAYDQGRDAPGADRHPDFRQRGKLYAGLVGARVVAETNQPRDIVAAAIGVSVDQQQRQSVEAADPAAFVDSRVALCQPLLEAELATDAASKPLPKPQRR